MRGCLGIFPNYQSLYDCACLSQGLDLQGMCVSEGANILLKQNSAKNEL